MTVEKPAHGLCPPPIFVQFDAMHRCLPLASDRYPRRSRAPPAVIPSEAEGSRVSSARHSSYQPSLRSLHNGLPDSISQTFLPRLQRFNGFSRSMADKAPAYSSK